MKLVLIEGAPVKNFEKELEGAMDAPLKHFEKELLKVRTGRANPALIENIKVNAYGSAMMLKEVGAISAPDVQLLVIQPWDINLINDIEKAISTSDLGLTPANDGNVIRIQLPKMSGSRRDELSKMLNKISEESRIAVRNIRKDVQNILKAEEKTKKLSEDYIRRLQDSLQKITDKFILAIDNLEKKKEAEIKLL